MAQRLMRGLLLALCLATSLAQADVAVPPIARVTDLSGTLDAAQRAALDAKLAAFEQEKGSQLAVLLLPTTAPETIEQYALRVAEAWKLGRAAPDDGALLLVAKDDRAVRIEVGYGLEGAIPDALAKRIIEEQMLPRFRSGDYATGIEAGVDGMIALIRKEALPAPPAAASPSAASDQPWLPIAFVALLLGQGLRRIFGRLFGGLIGGGLAFGAALFFAQAMLVAAGIGFAVFVLLLLGIVPMGGGFVSGGRGGGGGFGGGGFRGGGGGFGGGGASGRW